MEFSAERRMAAKIIVAVGLALVLMGAGVAQAGAARPPEAPSLNLSPNAGPAGTSVLAQGSFIGGPGTPEIASEAVALYFGGAHVAYGATNEHGVFAITFTVPTRPDGRYQVVAFGQSSHRVASATYTLSQAISGAAPIIRLKVLPDRGEPGSQALIEGRGLGCPAVMVSFVDAAGNEAPIGLAPIHSGVLRAQVTIPASAALGVGRVSAEGENPYLCSAAGDYWVCTECLGPAHGSFESKALGA